VPEILTIKPSVLNFGTVKMPHTSKPKKITIAYKKGKAGKNSLTVLIFAPGASSGFAIASDNCQASLDAGEGCALGITFTSTGQGKVKETLTINDNAHANPQRVTLIGNAR
jgi:hypothetical protein